MEELGEGLGWSGVGVERQQVKTTPPPRPQHRDNGREKKGEKNFYASTFSTVPFIIIQKLVFNATSSSNHVKVCMIQIVS